MSLQTSTNSATVQNIVLAWDMGKEEMFCSFHQAAPAVKNLARTEIYLCRACCEELAMQLTVIPDYVQTQWEQEREQ